MGHKDKKKPSFWSIVAAFVVYLFADVKTAKAAVSTGPEAALAAAAKHFSSAHKVNFN